MPDSFQHKFPPDFWLWLQEHPDSIVSAIIRVDALSSDVETTVANAGCRINRRLQLIPSLAVDAPSRALLQIAALPWVKRIEPDQSVRAL